MRYFALILSTGIALASIPAAAAVSDDAPRDATVVAYYSCPVYEGYPDCHPDSDVGAFAQPPHPRVTIAGSELRRPLHRRLSPSLAATARLRLPQ
jgi:hypothetical protein